MHTITVNTVDEALLEGMRFLANNGTLQETRNGKAYVSPVPVTTIYQKPTNRVLLNQTRDANPFFHLFEALWMLTGDDQVAFPGRFAKQLYQYSDDGVTLNGAYGARWRRAGHDCTIDQLDEVVGKLMDNPYDRRVVMSMWDPEYDLGASKDVCCNLAVKFSSQDGVTLDMFVFNRSNDIIWGAYGANAVHFSVLMEYVALASGLRVGKYYQISTDYHMYRDTFDKMKDVDLAPNGIREYCDSIENEYSIYNYKAIPLFDGSELPISFRQDCEDLISVKDFMRQRYRTRFFNEVVKPMMLTWIEYEDWKQNKSASRLSERCEPFSFLIGDKVWRRACREWISRRERSYLYAADDGVNYNGA